MLIQTQGRTAKVCVIDTNVVLDLWLFKRPSVAPLSRALLDGRLRMVGACDMRDELRHVLARACRGQGLDRKWLADGAAVTVLEAWDRHVTLGELGAPRGMVPRCTDAGDQLFIDSAVNSRVDWLLSRDRAVLKLARRLRPFGVSVLQPELVDWDNVAV